MLPLLRPAIIVAFVFRSLAFGLRRGVSADFGRPRHVHGARQPALYKVFFEQNQLVMVRCCRLRHRRDRAFCS